MFALHVPSYIQTSEVENHKFCNSSYSNNANYFSACNVGNYNCCPTNNNCCPTDNLNADYVIVGVGNAGALMANFLSSDLKTSVIALHSGQNLTEDPLIKFSRGATITVPASLFPNSLYQNGPTVPQVAADDRELTWAVALPEGGATSVNAGAWSRETNQFNAQWEAIAGPNWSPMMLTTLYKQLEDYHGATTNPSARGYNGPIDIRQVPLANVSAVSQKFTQAIINGTGFPFVLDYNDPDTPIGASSQMQYTQIGANGELRESSAVAFLNNAVMTPDGIGINGRRLKVIFKSYALRTMWSGTRAVGVEFLKDGVTQRTMASKGVIVCAGLKSSQFLMHSGIGPSSVLTSLGIPVKFDNPNVGSGLVDQASVHILFLTNPDDTQVPAVDPGLFTQIAYFPDPTGDQSIRQLRLATVNPIPGLTMGVFDLVEPKSRGTITITSNDPLQPPQVDPGYLTDSDDLNLLVRGFKVYIKNINNALQIIDPTYQLILPNPSILNDENAIIDYIKKNVHQNLSYQSHCRMAPLNQGGVVDSTGRVYGVQNVFVADDAVVPFCMDGAPMASAYAVAANIANMLML